MKIVLTGATGYIGKRLLPELIAQGHHVVCCVRDKNRFHIPEQLMSFVDVIEIDFLQNENLDAIPTDCEAAYYLMHSMSTSDDYDHLEKICAENFRQAAQKTKIRQVIYLSGIVNDQHLSKHLASRLAVENALRSDGYHLTTLRAGIIIGSGSASFEIIRDLVEKLPIMIAPKWLNTRCQPIAIRDVISALIRVLGHEATFDKHFDIGGPDILTYKDMLLGYAKVRGLLRYIITVPVMTPRLSSYWLYFVTSTSYKLATSLVSSMKVEVICQSQELLTMLTIKPIGYEEAIQRALEKIEGNNIISSWKDSFISGITTINITEFLRVPVEGCFVDKRHQAVSDTERTLENIWRIGGETGWYYANWLWKIRGIMDKLCGGVGLRRGRTHQSELEAGDAIDFWRVLCADKATGRLLLFAEMKLPGEAWLDFTVQQQTMTMTATFRPKGVLGRLYWYAVYPLHGLVFRGMLRRIAV